MKRCSAKNALFVPWSCKVLQGLVRLEHLSLGRSISCVDQRKTETGRKCCDVSTHLKSQNSWMKIFALWFVFFRNKSFGTLRLLGVYVQFKMWYRCKQENKKIRDLNFSGTDRLAVPGFMVHTCISKCNRDGSRKTKIQNVVEMQARKEDQLRITAVLKSSHIKISGRLICIESKNTKSDNVDPNETIDHTNTLWMRKSICTKSKPVMGILRQNFSSALRSNIQYHLRPSWP